MVSVPHANKHLIRFPIALEPMSLRRKGTHTDSSLIYTFCIAQGRYRSRCQPDQQEDFQPTPLTAKCDTYTHQDGELWKFNSHSVRNVPCISQMEGKGIQTIILRNRL